MFEHGVTFAADIRGGSPGTTGADYGWARAICFAGGSLMGLEAASGVASSIFEERGRDQVEWSDVPTLAGAIIFDFGARSNGVYPDKALGAAAYRARKPGAYPMGRTGAGRSATVGKLIIAGTELEPGGQGGAFREVGGVKIAAFCVVNALGCVLDRAGKVVRGNLDGKTGRRPSPAEYAESLKGQSGAGNTTLTLVVTDQKLSGRELTQLSRQVHASMARAIQPFHTSYDGDVLFFATTNEVERGPIADAAQLGVVASEVVWDAVLASFDPD